MRSPGVGSASSKAGSVISTPANSADARARTRPAASNPSRGSLVHRPNEVATELHRAKDGQPQVASPLRCSRRTRHRWSSSRAGWVAPPMALAPRFREGCLRSKRASPPAKVPRRGPCFEPRVRRPSPRANTRRDEPDRVIGQWHRLEPNQEQGVAFVVHIRERAIPPYDQRGSYMPEAPGAPSVKSVPLRTRRGISWCSSRTVREFSALSSRNVVRREMCPKLSTSHCPNALPM